MQAKQFLAFWRGIRRAGNAEAAARQVLMHVASKRKRAATSDN